MNELNIRNLRLVDFGYNLNKTRQTLLDVILQERDGLTVIPTLAKKITSKLAEVNIDSYIWVYLRSSDQEIDCGYRNIRTVR